MKRFVYVITDRNRTSLHVGMSSDLLKTISFYKEMPNLFFDNASQLSRLIYFEELLTEQDAMNRFNQICKFTRTQKEKLVREVNPDWIDLAIGLDYEEKVMKADISALLRIRKAA